jgi:hypothetical protein
MATIAAKLAASEKEADAARVRAKLRAMKLARVKKGDANGQREEDMSRDTSDRSIRTVEAEEALERSAGSKREGNGDGEVDIVVEKPRKREREPGRRTGKVASRRRSTLNPQELKSLIQGEVNVGLA